MSSESDLCFAIWSKRPALMHYLIEEKTMSSNPNEEDDKYVPREKENQIHGGDEKHFRLKRKMDADQFRSGTPPKMSKTENVCDADKKLNPGMDLEKVALCSRTGASETGKLAELKQKDFDDSVLKMDAQCSTDRKTVSQQSLTKEFEGKLNVSSPVRINSNLLGFESWKEAIKLEDRADDLKKSGLEFESNETYFQAGLKYLHGTSLMKECSFESSLQFEIGQIVNYDGAAKLFKSCAHEYESRQDMSSAALAYKCMEVAYVRLVFCKLSSADRVLDELLLAAQGKSPSSAFDVDNLNNQVGDKATVKLVVGNLVVSGRTCPNWIDYIDYSQDYVFAYEACRKCQSTFAAASAIMEEAKARNLDAIAAIQSVIDFGYKDGDAVEFVNLVQIARKAINPAGLGAARD